jgi:hypothetical protein
MSKPLDDLLFTIRQHPAFPELLLAIDTPSAREFSPSKGDSAAQYAEYIFRSGMRRQHSVWRQFLIGEPTSDKEKS